MNIRSTTEARSLDRACKCLAVLAALLLLVGCVDREEPPDSSLLNAEGVADSVPAIAVSEPPSDTVMARDTATSPP